MEEQIRLRIPNTGIGLTAIRCLRAALRKNNTIKVFGRCKDKRTAFAETGRHYTPGQSNSNSIYSIDSPLAPYCYEWVVYVTPKRGR